MLGGPNATLARAPARIRTRAELASRQQPPALLGSASAWASSADIRQFHVRAAGAALRACLGPQHELAGNGPHHLLVGADWEAARA
eukprot:3785136-Alexandrium_andersonii.AAC.1